MNFFLIIIGKVLSVVSKTFNLGHGSTWPGHIALILNKRFIHDLLKNSSAKFVIIAGTNGKTTTSRMITAILKKSGKSVFQNESGANLLNGIASTMLLHTNIAGKLTKDYGVFEVDENSLPLVLQALTPESVVLLNLFRDQLDRYGEIDSISKKWSKSLSAFPHTTSIILNADDPQIAYLGKNIKAPVVYFGLQEKSEKKQLQHASDSTYCPQCHKKLSYKTIYYSHLGNWFCPNCKLKRPRLAALTSMYPLPGTYNKYNTLAAVVFAKTQKIDNETIQEAFVDITPAFGRQEKISFDGKEIQIFLSKNPASFNQSLETIKNLGARSLLFVLNDRIPDGRDVSWIWDVDFEDYDMFKTIIISGDRVHDMALRLQYAEKKFQAETDLDEAIKQALHTVKEAETLYILPTYSAMLEVRKILTGKKIL